MEQNNDSFTLCYNIFLYAFVKQITKRHCYCYYYTAYIFCFQSCHLHHHSDVRL